YPLIPRLQRLYGRSLCTTRCVLLQAQMLGRCPRPRATLLPSCRTCPLAWVPRPPWLPRPLASSRTRAPRPAATLAPHHAPPSPWASAPPCAARHDGRGNSPNPLGGPHCRTTHARAPRAGTQMGETQTAAERMTTNTDCLATSAFPTSPLNSPLTHRSRW